MSNVWLSILDDTQINTSGNKEKPTKVKMNCDMVPLDEDPTNTTSSPANPQVDDDEDVETSFNFDEEPLQKEEEDENSFGIISKMIKSIHEQASSHSQLREDFRLQNSIMKDILRGITSSRRQHLQDPSCSEGNDSWFQHMTVSLI